MYLLVAQRVATQLSSASLSKTKKKQIFAPPPLPITSIPPPSDYERPFSPLFFKAFLKGLSGKLYVLPAFSPALLLRFLPQTTRVVIVSFSLHYSPPSPFFVFSSPHPHSLTMHPTLRCPSKGALALILCLLFHSSFKLTAAATSPPTWQVQSDYFGERNAIAQPRTIRGLALSADERSIYHGNIQSPNTGSTALRKVKSDILAIEDTDHVIFGNGMPGGTGAFGQVALQPVYAGGSTGTFQAWVDADNSPESISADDRGYVYVALSSGVTNANRVDIWNADLSIQVGSIASSSPTGVAVRKIDSTYWLYVSSGAGLRRFDVTTSFNSAADSMWPVPPLPGIFGGTDVAVDSDGTVFLVGNNQVRRINSDGQVTHTIALTNAHDVAIFQNKIYVVKRQRPAQPIVVLNKADLSSGGDDLVIPPLGRSGLLGQLTSIKVGRDGRLFVSEENYKGNSTGCNTLGGDCFFNFYTPPATSFNPTPGTIGSGRIYFDRILVSSSLPDEVAPSITCPVDMSVTAATGESSSAVVETGVAAATDDLGEAPIVTSARSDGVDVNDPYPIGFTTITWTATDAAGNTDSCMQTITVSSPAPPQLTLQGFFQPVDNLPTTNRARAGRTVPLKFRVMDGAGAGIPVPGLVVVVTPTAANNQVSGAVDYIETYTTRTGLQYLGDGNYQWNWATPNSYAGSSRGIMLSPTADGYAFAPTSLKADFTFTK
jgi:hypothetical protein